MTASPPPAAAPVRIAAVSYLNTTPLIEGVPVWRDGSLDRVVPSRIADLVADGSVDVGLVSLADFARSPEAFAMLPCGMIGCDGPTLTVRVFSAVPPERVTTLHADTDSHTSVVLAQLVLKSLHGVTPAVVDFDARERSGPQGSSEDPAEAWPETVLLIGDKVVTDSPPAIRYPYQIDLGEAWHRMTGLPFVYAVWMCLEGRFADPAVTEATALLDRQRRRNKARLDQIITSEAGKRGWPGDLARQYVGELLRFEVDDRAREAAALFLKMGAEAGLLPDRPVRWSDRD